MTASALLDRPPLLADLPAARVLKECEQRAARLAAAGVEAGETVGLAGENGTTWLVGLLALLRLGARPLLLPKEAPPQEVERLLGAAGGGRYVRTTAGGAELLGASSTLRREPGTLLLCSSGSMGAPKLVERCVASLVAEGRRYVDAGLVAGGDTVVIPLPMSHAYALGWVAGVLLTGARLVPLEPTALGAVEKALEDGATTLVLSPGHARLLLRRLPASSGAGLRVAMVGAGAVDADLDRAWAERIGTGLARNYGSSETGAVLSGPAGLPTGCIGTPMPHVEVRLDSATRDAQSEVGEAVVVLEDGSEHNVGDVLRRDPAGRFYLVGRRQTAAVRRGGRWVSTAEVERVLRAAYGVADVAVSAGGGRDDDRTLVAEYVPAGRCVDAESLRAHCRSQLAVHEVPDIFRPRRRLRRTTVGKLRADVIYRLSGAVATPHPALVAERAMVLRALARLGALPLLASGASAPILAADLAADPDTLADLLDAAHGVGAVEVVGDEPAAGAPPEARLAAWVAELDSRGADLAPSHGYSAAPGVAAAVRCLAGVRADDRVLEIAGRRPPAAADDPADAEPYDICLVVDALHGSGPAADLDWLARRLCPGGRLVVHDHFLDSTPCPAAATVLAWLTEGCHAWWRLADLEAGLASVGCPVEHTRPTDDPPGTLVVARRAAP